MTSHNTAGRIGKAWGLKAARSYTENIGWTTAGALDKARRHAAYALMRSYLGLEKDTTYKNASIELQQLSWYCDPRDGASTLCYEDYCNLYSRLDRELVKAYHGATS